MIFLGDIASPSADYSEKLSVSLDKYRHLFEGQTVAANLEGVLADISTASQTPVLFNHPSVLKTFKGISVKALSLANNHTLDLPDFYENTIQALNDESIVSFGAGISKKEAFAPIHFSAEGVDFSIMGACWHVMLQHQNNPNKGVFVATLDEQKILDIIRQEKEKYPNRKLIFMPHWNLDLEKVPFPLHRVFAKACIDAGATAVIGNHSHCIQGAERYKDGFIVYGLGNFYIPWGTFINGTIHFPDFTKISLALEWCPKSNDLNCHYFEYDEKKHNLTLIKSEKFDNGEWLKKYTPYAGLSNIEYIEWYKKNRRKGFLMPVYKDHKETFKNRLYDSFLINRIRFARFLAKSGLRKWNN